MPWLQLFTNLPRSKVAAELPSKLAKIMSTNLEKPLDRIRIHIMPDEMVSFAGSTDPCAIMTVSSIGKITREINERNTKDIMSLLSNELNIPQARQTIYFNDLRAENVGLDGKILAPPPQ